MSCPMPYIAAAGGAYMVKKVAAVESVKSVLSSPAIIESIAILSITLYIHFFTGSNISRKPSTITLVSALISFGQFLLHYRRRHDTKESLVGGSDIKIRRTKTTKISCSSDQVSNNDNDYNGKDTDGLIIGSTLAPIYCLSLQTALLKYYSSDKTNNGTNNLEVYALMSSLSGLIFVLFRFRRNSPSSISSIILHTVVCATLHQLFHPYLSLILSSPFSSMSSSFSVRISVAFTVFKVISWHPTLFFDSSSPVSRTSKSHNINKNKEEHRMLPPLQRVLTYGEYELLSTVISILFTDTVASSGIFGPSSSSDKLCTNVSCAYDIVSKAGVTGCFLGCILLRIMVIASRKITKKGSYVDTSLSGNELFLMISSNVWFRCAVVCICTAMTVELVLYSKQHASSGQIIGGAIIDYSFQTNGTENGNSPAVITMNMPLAIDWIVTFLTIPSSCNERNDRGSSNICTFLLIGSMLLIPPFVKMSQWLLDNNNKIPVVVKRKYFHLVAIVLFAPMSSIQCFNVMYLAYAVAFCLLILLEVCRTSNISSQSDASFLTNYYQLFLDEKDKDDGNSAIKGKESRNTNDNGHGVIITHMTLLLGCAIPLWACQLFVQELISDGNACANSLSLPSSSLKNLTTVLRRIGIITVAFGDGMAAIVGKLYGKTKWSIYTNRTMEGSQAMFISMLIVSMIWFKIDAFTLMKVFGTITILEGCTYQIDNVYLGIIVTCLCCLLV